MGDVKTYQFGEDEHVESSMRAILEAAGDRAGEVQYKAGVGPAGAVEGPTDAIDEFERVKAEHDEEQRLQEEAARREAEKTEADSADDTDETTETEAEQDTSGQVTQTRRGRRTAAKTDKE